MILGTQELLKLVKEKNLVEGLSQRELKRPTGTGFELRLGELFEIRGPGFLGIEDRQTPTEKSLAKYDPRKTTKILLKPGQFYLAQTVETVKQTENLQIVMFPRSSLFRSGLLLLSSFGDPGWQGKLTFGLINLHNQPFTIEMGARFVQINFFEIKGKILKPYQGQWQGGRVSARKKEKQV